MEITEELNDHQKEQLKRVIMEFIRSLWGFGWEREVYIKKNGVFDNAITSLGDIEKGDDGFEYENQKFIYVKP